MADCVRKCRLFGQPGGRVKAPEPQCLHGTAAFYGQAPHPHLNVNGTAAFYGQAPDPIGVNLNQEMTIRTSTSMKQRHFMDEGSIDVPFATPGCHREASRRGGRAEVRAKHRQETGLTPVPDSLAT